jgi:hypothetical protein
MITGTSGTDSRSLAWDHQVQQHDVGAALGDAL